MAVVKEYLSQCEAAELVGVTVRHLRRLVDAGKLPAPSMTTGKPRYSTYRLRKAMERGTTRKRVTPAALNKSEV